MTKTTRGGGFVRLSQRLVQLEQTLSVALLCVVVITLAAQVIARYVFRSPISWSEEVARLALIWLTFVSSGFLTAHREQITVDLFPRRFSTRTRERINQLAGWIVLLTCLLLLVGGFRFVWRVWPVSSPGIELSMSYWYAAASFGLALMSFHTAVQLFAEPRQAANARTHIDDDCSVDDPRPVQGRNAT